MKWLMKLKKTFNYTDEVTDLLNALTRWEQCGPNFELPAVILDNPVDKDDNLKRTLTY